MSDAHHLEAIRAIRDTYVQGIKTGRFPESAVTRQWVLGDVCQGCDACESIAAGNPDPIGVHIFYRTLATQLEMPPAHEGCDCSEKYITTVTHENRDQFSQPSGVKAPKQLPMICLPFVPD